jgi:predicted AAA+ superfamily ATPase
VIHAPKFYFANVGVVNWLAKRKLLEPGSTEFGKAFENVILNEIRAWNAYHKAAHNLSYWKLASGAEVDLIIEDLGMAIEIKSSRTISAKHLAGLRELIQDQPQFKRRMIVSLEDTSRVTSDEITIYSVGDFLEALWADFPNT